MLYTWAFMHKEISMPSKMFYFMVTPVLKYLVNPILVILMEFIGDDGIPAKLLKDWVSSITKLSKWISYYVEVIKHMRTMYQVCKLVHGDLSEFNILLHKGFVQIIAF